MNMNDQAMSRHKNDWAYSGHIFIEMDNGVHPVTLLANHDYVPCLPALQRFKFSRKSTVEDHCHGVILPRVPTWLESTVPLHKG